MLVGCGEAQPSDSSALQQADIVFGERSVDSDDSVVQVTAHPPGSVPQSCTGTLVAPNIVLTALHCVAQYTSGDINCRPDGSLSSTATGAGAIGELASPDQVEIRTGVYPGAAPQAVGVKLFGTGTNQICRNDFAIVVLDRDLPLPLSAMRLQNGVELGELARIVGYGSTESPTSMGRYVRSGLQIIDRGLDAGGSSSNLAAPRTVVTGQGGCHGDSGGPIFSEATGALVGVYSLVSGASCTAIGVRNVYTRLEPFASLVQSAFDFAAQTPILEPVTGGEDAGVAGGSSSNAGSGQGSSAGLDANAGRAGSVRPGGSGSRQDASCACRAAPASPHWSLGLGALLGCCGLLVRRLTRLRRV